MAAINPQDVIDYAMTFNGVPYVWGGTSMAGVDCSGFMYLVAQHFGISIPRGSRDQIKLGNQVGSIQQAQPGDMIGFDSEGDGTAEHIGMYLGNGQIIVADNPSTGVHITSLSTEARIVGIVRLPGVVNLNGQPPSGSAFTSLVSPMGTTSVSAIPAAQPTFDWWSGIGLKSPNLPTADETYGLIDTFIRTDPELANLYSEAVAGSWSQDQFVSALQETDWWKTNSDSARQFLTMKNTDPAAWNQQVANQQVKIRDLAVSMGVTLSANGLQNLASTSLILNQNDAQLKQQLANYLTLSQQGWYGGYAGQVELGLKAYAQDMGVPLSDAYVQNAVQNIVAGSDTLQAHRAFIQTTAAGTFPAYANLINEGTTVGQIAAPYLTAMSNIWEVNPDSVDLFNSTLRGALQAKDASGNPAIKQVYDFETQLRQDPRWQTTNNAREGLMSATKGVLSDMGLISTDLGSAPQTSPNQLTYLSPTTQNTGLAGQTSFPTLQDQQALENPTPPTLESDSSSSTGTSAPPSATSLAPDLSGQPTGPI